MARTPLSHSNIVNSGEHHLELRRAVGQLVGKYGRKYFQDKVRTGGKVDELWGELGEAGFLGVHISEKWGGGGGGIVPYAAAKASVEALTIGLARELAGQNIRVNAVRPGAINTDLNDFSANPAHEKRFAETTPLGRVGEPEEVAEAILWLLSEQSAYVNGSILPVTGGR